MSSSKNIQLWMGYIENYMTEIFIKNAFTKMGVTPPVAVKIVKKFGPFTTDMSYGFVHFKTEQEALNALHVCNTQPIPNSQPTAKFCLNHVVTPSAIAPPPAEYSAYVGDLANDVNDTQLFNLFSEKFPSLKSSKIQYRKGFRLGHAFLAFGDEADVQKCVKIMNGYNLNGRPIRVSMSNRDTTSGNKNLSVNQKVSDSKFWHNFTSLADNYYPTYIPQDLLNGHSIDIPSFSRFYSKNELELIDHGNKLDYTQMNSAISYQHNGLWDPLLISAYSVPDINYNECVDVASSC